jgi:cadmium resistance protein CadD (predicted permease)
VSPGIIAAAAGLFAVTNIDDLLVLALFFAQGAGHEGATRSITIGQYLGFVATLFVAVAASLGATLLPEDAIPYLGVLPLALGIRAGIRIWSHRNDSEDGKGASGRPGSLEVATVTFANGGDNIGVYVPVFATTGVGGMSIYIVVFLVLLGVWIAAGRYFATRAAVAAALSRWGHILLPVVLTGIGLLILIGGGAFDPN